jgi:hypothetical protein
MLTGRLSLSRVEKGSESDGLAGFGGGVSMLTGCM